MKRVSLEAVKPGMKLARTAINQTGQIILKAGTELTTPLLAQLKSNGITLVEIATFPGEGETPTYDWKELERSLDQG